MTGNGFVEIFLAINTEGDDDVDVKISLD